MSEELDRIREVVNSYCRYAGSGSSGVLRHEVHELLDAYERKLVRVEGVEEAYDMLRANDCASVGCASESPRTLEVGVWDHDETGWATISICPELNDGCSGEVNVELLEAHIAQCIAALHILKGK